MCSYVQYIFTELLTGWVSGREECWGKTEMHRSLSTVLKGVAVLKQAVSVRKCFMIQGLYDKCYLLIVISVRLQGKVYFSSRL